MRTSVFADSGTGRADIDSMVALPKVADAYHKAEGFVLEVEAGRAVANNQFLKDLFQARMMHGVRRLGIAVRQVYRGGGADSRDFERVVAFFDALYASSRLELPLEEILVIGY